MKPSVEIDLGETPLENLHVYYETGPAQHTELLQEEQWRATPLGSDRYRIESLVELSDDARLKIHRSRAPRAPSAAQMRALQAADDAAAAKRATARTSARAKLKALGLTDEEVDAVIPDR